MIRLPRCDIRDAHHTLPDILTSSPEADDVDTVLDESPDAREEVDN